VSQAAGPGAELGLELRVASVCSGGLLSVQVRAPAGEAVDLRLLLQLREPDSARVFDEQVVGTWRAGTRREHELRLPVVAPSWRGQQLEVLYLLEAKGAASGSLRRTVLVRAAAAPEDPEAPAPAEQRRWRQLQEQKRGLGSCIGAVVEIILSLGSLAALGSGAVAVLAGHRPGASELFVALGCLFWLGAYGLVLVRRLLSRRAHLGWVEPPVAALGGAFQGHALHPLRWGLVLRERYSVGVGVDGQTRPMTLDREVASGRVGAGAFEIPVPLGGPASVGAEHGGVSWWVRLGVGRAVQQHPVEVRPWVDPRIEAELQELAARRQAAASALAEGGTP